jgi:hypothetical protein
MVMVREDGKHAHARPLFNFNHCDDGRRGDGRRKSRAGFGSVEQ